MKQVMIWVAMILTAATANAWQIPAAGPVTAVSKVFEGTLEEARAGADGYSNVTTTGKGSGSWRLDENDHTSADNTGMVFVTRNGSRYKRVIEDNVILPEWFGVLPDGRDHVAAFQALCDADISGKTLRFGSGVYIVANDTQRILFEKKHDFKLSGNGKTVFSNLAGNGGKGGENIWIDTCTNVEISGIRMLDLVLTRAGTYNNLLVLIASRNVKIHDCYFGYSSNKHIHIGGNAQNTEIYHNVFEHSHYNTNPFSNTTFGSIFLYLEGPEQQLTDVNIHDNKFRNNMLFCVSANNFNIASGKGQANCFRNITVNNNTIDSCGAAFIIRCNGFVAEGNIITYTGFANLSKHYIYIDSLRRYFAKTRANAGMRPSKENTMTPLCTGGIFTFSQSSDFRIVNNVFAGGLVAQDVTMPGVIQETVYLNAASVRNGIIRNNRFIDSVNAGARKPLITVFTKPEGLTVNNNSFVLPEAYNSPYLIKIDNPAANKISLNKASVKGQKSGSSYKGIIFDNAPAQQKKTP